MQKVSVTYRKRDASDPDEVVWNGVRFTAGKAVDVSNKAILRKVAGNPWFEMDGEMPEEDENDPPKRRGRPPKAKEDQDVA